MGRARCYAAYADAAGNKLSGTSVYAYDPGTTNPIAATIYDSFTGGGTLANPLTTDANGGVLFYLAAPQRLDLLFLKAGYADFTLHDVQATPDAADILLVTSVLDGANLGAGSVPATALANGAATGVVLGSDVVRPNFLTNPGFEIWQRGAGAFTGDTQYGPDRWKIALAAGDTISVSKDLANKAVDSTAAAACAYTKSTGSSRLSQFLMLSDGRMPTGKMLTFNILAKLFAGVGSAVRPFIITDGTGGAGTFGSYHGNNTLWEALSVSAIIPADATFVQVGVQFDAQCIAYLDNAMLCMSAIPVPYVPFPPAEEWARCLRYCWAVSIPAYASLVLGTATSATLGKFLVQFPILMAVAPSMTVTATDWAMKDLSGGPIDVTVLTLDQSRTDGGSLTATVASGLTAFRPYALAADATANRVMIFEANPA